MKKGDVSNDPSIFSIVEKTPSLKRSNSCREKTRSVLNERSITSDRYYTVQRTARAFISPRDVVAARMETHVAVACAKKVAVIARHITRAAKI